MAVPRPDLMCDVRELRYDFDKRTGILVMAENGSCSMSGLTALFASIDPEVERIATISGDKPDGMYRLGVDGWETISVR